MALKRMRQFDPHEIIHSYHYDSTNNEIYLFGIQDYAAGNLESEDYEEPGVEYCMANRFIINLNLAIGAAKKGEPIIVHMKTNGGDWYQGMSIYDAIKVCQNPVVIINYTYARSMSSIIFQAADRRIMMPHSHFMYHEGDYGDSGTMKQVRTNLQWYDKSNDAMLDIYVARMRQSMKWKDKPRRFIRDHLVTQMNLKEDVWLDAKGAIENGFADEIFTSWRNIRDASKLSKKEKEKDQVNDTRGHKGLKGKDRRKRSARRV